MERPAPLALLDRRAIVDQQVPMVSGVLLALLVLQVRVVLMELPVLSDQRATPVLPDPRGGMDHKAHLDPRVSRENVVLLVIVERSAPLALPALLASAAPLALPALLASAAPLALVWISSGPSR